MDVEQEPGEPRTCLFCERVWGLVGVAAGLAILFIGVDLMLGGGLTRALFGRPLMEAGADE
jgi:hypothetical protein